MTQTLQKPADGKIQVLLRKIPSLNQFYSSKHWSVRAKWKNVVGTEVLAGLSRYDKVVFAKMSVEVRCNMRMDIDNCIMAAKIGIDTFKDWGGIADDTPKYVTEVRLLVDKELERGTCQIFFIDLS